SDRERFCLFHLFWLNSIRIRRLITHLRCDEHREEIDRIPVKPSVRSLSWSPSRPILRDSAHARTSVLYGPDRAAEYLTGTPLQPDPDRTGQMSVHGHCLAISAW